jgi:DNA-binding transcriptional LysR family regulator
MERESLSQLSIFVAVAQASSFREAGRRLNLSSSAISQSVARLERALATRLFERSTRSVQLTPEGQVLFAEVAPALASIERAVESGRAKPGAVHGSLRITVPRVCATFLLADRLADFARTFPSIRLEVNVDDGVVDIVGAGFDAGIRLHEQLERDMIAVPIGGPQRMIAVAAPAFLAGHARPEHPRDLLDLPCIALRLQSGILYSWEFERLGAATSVAVQGPLIVNDDHLALSACRDGAGIAFLFEATVRDDLASGRLVPLLEEWSPAFSGFYLYHTSHRHVRPPLRAFIDWMRNDGDSQAR